MQNYLLQNAVTDIDHKKNKIPTKIVGNEIWNC